jgi:hypothetical protein
VNLHPVVNAYAIVQISGVIVMLIDEVDT